MEQEKTLKELMALISMLNDLDVFIIKQACAMIYRYLQKREDLILPLFCVPQFLKEIFHHFF